MYKNKILFMLHLPPPVHGSSIVGKLIKDSQLINNSFETQYINLLISRSIDESGKINILKLFRFFISWFKLLFRLIRDKPNLCYFALTTTSSAFYKDAMLVFLLRLFQVKTVFHLHNKGIKTKESTRVNCYLYRYVFKKNNVILLSKYLFDDVKNFVPEKKVYICHNGVEDIMKVTKKIYDKESRAVKILFLSNLIESKGIFVLLEACKILLSKGYKFSCDFVGGEGDVSANLFQSEVQRNGVHESVEYLGKKYGEEKNDVFKSADIFVLPTYYQNECFPLVLLESMQYGLPIVSTFEGGIQDIVENGVTGFLVPQKDVQALAEKLELLIMNPELRIKMGIAGRKKYEKEFTLQIFETKLEEILHHLLLNE